jgi:hypothetical protein
MAKHAASRRSGTQVIVGLGVVALLAATAFVIADRMNSATADRPATQTSSSTSESTQPATTAAPTTSVHPAASVTVGSIPASLPETGPGLTEPGILLIATPAPDGTFDMLERIQLSRPVSVLTLRPAPVARAGRQFAAASAAATQVRVSAGSQPVVVPGATIAASTDLPVTAVDQFELRYRLTGVTVRSTPSTAGRALAAIGPLTGGVDEDLPVLFIVTGGTVLGLACPLLPLEQQACGSRVQTGTSVERSLPWRLALTSVQFNLPLG